MGPRSLDRGIFDAFAKSMLQQLLQWGRDLSIAESSRRPSSHRLSHQLQWGRDLSIAESASVSRPASRSRVLQWGRDLSIAESRVGRVQVDDGHRASMGPRSLDRGIRSPSKNGCMPPILLQWGRDLSIAESPSAVTPSPSSRALQWGRDLSIAESSRRKVQIS